MPLPQARQWLSLRHDLVMPPMKVTLRGVSGTHKPLTPEPDWNARQPGFSEEDPGQSGPMYEGSGHFSQWLYG